MSKIDISDNAGLFIFGIVFICAILAFLNYKNDGRDGAIAIFLWAFVGMWISIGIINLANFDDATPEVVITTYIGAIGFPLIYTMLQTTRWISLRRIRKLKNKICNLQKELEDIESKLYREKNVLNLIKLLRNCCGDVDCFEQHPKLSSQKMLSDKADKLREKIEEISSKI